MNGKCWHCDATDHDTADCPGRYKGGSVHGSYKDHVRHCADMQNERDGALLCRDIALKQLESLARDVVAPQPPPVQNDGTPVWDLVITDMRARKEFGGRKYGTYLQAFNGRDALMDAYQEALDLCVYLRQAIEERRAG